MNTFTRFLVVAVALPAFSTFSTLSRAADSNSEFSSSVFDLGVVVSDVEQSVEFYTEAIGFKEMQGFSVNADWAGDVGLTDDKSLDIHVLVLGEGEQATRLKLMEVPGTSPKKPDSEHIHSQFGYSYITIEVKDMNRAMERLEKAGVEPLANGPKELPEGLPQGIYLAVVKDPDGNFIELVGPRN